jgi:hypothetical protein
MTKKIEIPIKIMYQGKELTRGSDTIRDIAEQIISGDLVIGDEWELFKIDADGHEYAEFNLVPKPNNPE